MWNNKTENISGWDLVLSLALLVLAGCSQKESAPQTHDHPNEPGIVLTPDQVKQAGIQWDTLQSKMVSEELEVTGMLDVPPQNLFSVSAMASGFVESTSLIQGKKVEKGEVIAVLKNPDFLTMQQEYQGNQGRLTFLELEMDRQKKLSDEQIAAKKEYQKILADFQGLKAQQGGIREKLKMLGFDLAAIEKGQFSSTISIKAPISGNVTMVGINLGKFVQPQDIIAEIVNTRHLHAELTIFEQDLGKIAIGQHLDFFLQSAPGKVHHAHIYLINQKMNNDRTVRVHAHLDEDDPNLIPNQLLNAKIQLQAKKMPALPEAAFIRSGNQDYVYQYLGKEKEGFRFQRVAVQKVASIEKAWGINFPENDVNGRFFVTRGAFDLLSVEENGGEDEHHH